MTTRRLGIAALAGLCLLAVSATSAEAATDSLYAAPTAIGAADCSSPADACPIATAVTSANAEPVTDSVRVELARGVYQLSGPPTPVLAVTFAGPSLTFAAGSGTPVLSGTRSAAIMSVAVGSNVTVDGLEFDNGLSTSPGGAIINNGTLTVQDSTFSGNTGANGGALSNSAGATMVVQDSTFSHNNTTGVGGGALINFGTATVERSALVNNTAPINGGAINTQPAGTTTLNSSTISGNTSGGLGGGLSNLGTTNVQGSTISDNSASAGTAIATGNTNVTVAASIITSPAPASVGACNPLNVATTDGGYNLDDDGTCISADTPAVGSHSGIAAYGSSTYGAVLDAYLGGLANHGGPTPTIPLLNSANPLSTLTNPAFAVVPPSFDLPVAVDGETAACAASDQRGVFPATGLNCDIGSYLLQATTTALAASAPTVEQNGTITYTATVTPAPGAGTVSFDDGAGHPATVRCAAQGLSSAGTATCTVPYAGLGTYPVTASYSGDGTTNNYGSSVSTAHTVVVTAPAPPPAAAPVAPAPDRTPPMTTLRRVTSTKQPITLRGGARDDGTVSVVRVSVALHVGGLCRFLAADHKLTKARSCDRTSYLDARGTTAWSLKLPKLPAGRYTVWTRGIDAAGNIERKRRSRNVLVVRILAPKTAAKKSSAARSAAAPARVAVLAP